MNIDEFLISNQTKENVGEYTIFKIKYNDNIDFLYKPSYGEFEYGKNLEFLGIYEKITKKLYGNSCNFHSEYSGDLYSNYYECPIDKISQNIKDGVNVYLNNYMDKNRTQLMTIAKEVFDKHIANDWTYKNIRHNIINNYIYYNKTKKNNFSVNDYYYKNNIKELTLKYIQNPIETISNVFNEYINNKEKIESVYFDEKYNKVSVKEYLGVRLLEEQLKDSLLQELVNNPNNKFKKKRDIVQSIKNLDAQMVTITLKHNNELFDFKYPKRLVESMDFYESHIPNLEKRAQIKQLLKENCGIECDELFMKEIIKIEYNKKIIYEDKELLNLKENFSKDTIETHDIVDDMFE